ncbi:MAG: LD-carboxypeptidase [Candidatus Koribacter versatilis]|uniref:LD-carboxypeptidase n=1 Tax=Candidatus Korobacter versatilis TaxID=658062 RepID=A0A932A8T8_9BACT|nr:LD-carboxypeptidase [Candidatus Koribacter versatilis]
MPSPAPTRRKPPALLPGDTVGIVAPASNLQPAMLEAGVRGLERMGYRPFYLPSILDQDIFFAGSVERRARELEEMFGREEVRAILCARGGYGANTLLGALDLKKIAVHPKIFCGCSDITTLLTYFTDAGGFVTLHGPMVTKDFAGQPGSGVELASWQAAVSGKAEWEIASSDVRTLVEGSAEGVLYGGCLSMLVASLGTPYEIETSGTILFMEDVATKPYQIDRMLMHLRLAGKFEGVRGIVLGEMLDCKQHPDQKYTLDEVILRVVGELGVPVATGLKSGHVTGENITLPIGVRARLAANQNVKLTVLESATAPRSAEKPTARGRS